MAPLEIVGRDGEGGGTNMCSPSVPLANNCCTNSNCFGLSVGDDDRLIGGTTADYCRGMDCPGCDVCVHVDTHDEPSCVDIFECAEPAVASLPAPSGSNCVRRRITGKQPPPEWMRSTDGVRRGRRLRYKQHVPNCGTYVMFSDCMRNDSMRSD